MKALLGAAVFLASLVLMRQILITAAALSPAAALLFLVAAVGIPLGALLFLEAAFDVDQRRVRDEIGELRREVDRLRERMSATSDE